MYGREDSSISCAQLIDVTLISMTSKVQTFAELVKFCMRFVRETASRTQAVHSAMVLQ